MLDFTWAVFHFSSPPPWAIAISWGTTSTVIATKCQLKNVTQYQKWAKVYMNS